MTEFISFFVVIAAGLLFSAFFSRLHLPWVAALLAAGIVTGPFGLGLFQNEATLEFLGSIGLVFLMFQAGLEIDLGRLLKHVGDFTVITLLNAIIPFVLGVTVVLLAGYGILPALLMGTVLLSTSVAVIVPMLESQGIKNTSLGELSLGTAILSDVISLIIFTALLQTGENSSPFPLPVFLVVLIIVFAGLHWLMPKLRWLAVSSRNRNFFQRELRLIIGAMIGIVLIFEILGVHPVVAGFMAGILMGKLVKTEQLMGKLQIISYGVFIPIFFVVAGSQVDWRILVTSREGTLLAVAVISLTISVKFLSGYVAGKIRGFSSRVSGLLGASTIPQLTVPLAVAFTGSMTGMLDEKLTATLIGLVITTTLVGPYLFNLICSRVKVTDELQNG